MPGEETPYYYEADGVIEAYIRIGNESVKADSTELKRLVLRGKNTTWDTQVSTYKTDDFAFSKLRARYKKWTGKSFYEKDLISFGLASEDGNLFKTIMPNLNYGFDVKKLDTNNTELDAKLRQVDVIDANQNRKNRIQYLIRINPRMTQRVMAEETGIPFRTLQRIMAEMVENGEIKRVGTSQKGHWEINEV